MKLFVSSLLFMAVAVCSSRADRIYFSTGDVIDGRLAGYETKSNLELGSSPALGVDDRVLWSSEIFKKDASFALADIERIEFDRGEETQFEANTLAMLANGDIHEGKMLELSEDELLIQTEYADELKIKRWFVTQLRFPSKSEFAYFGPNRLGEWIQHGEEGDWKLIDGKLTTTTSEVIGLQRKGTDRSHISFDAEWEKRANFRLRIAANSAEPGELKDSFDISVSGGQLKIFRTHRGRNNRRGRRGNVRKVAEFEETGGGRFDIYCNRSLGQVRVLFNGERISSWQDQRQQRQGLGGSFVIENLTNSKLTFGNMEIVPWNGVAPEEDEKTKNDEALLPSRDGDRLVLINGDSVQGEIGGLANDQLELKAVGLDLQVPIERVRLLRLFNPIFVEFGKVPSPRQYNRDVRLRLKSGRSLTFRIKGIEGDELLAYSEATGEVRLSLKAFSEAQFDLYTKY